MNKCTKSNHASTTVASAHVLKFHGSYMRGAPEPNSDPRSCLPPTKVLQGDKKNTEGGRSHPCHPPLPIPLGLPPSPPTALCTACPPWPGMAPDPFAPFSARPPPPPHFHPLQNHAPPKGDRSRFGLSHLPPPFCHGSTSPFFLFTIDLTSQAQLQAPPLHPSPSMHNSQRPGLLAFGLS